MQVCYNKASLFLFLNATLFSHMIHVYSYHRQKIKMIFMLDRRGGVFDRPLTYRTLFPLIDKTHEISVHFAFQPEP